MIWGLLKSGLSVGLVRLVGSVLGFVLTVVLSQMLGPAGLGKFALISTILLIVAVPVSHAIATMVLRETSGARIRNDWGEVRGLNKMGLYVGLTIAVLFLLVGIAGTGFETTALLVILFATVILFFDQGSALRASTLRGLDKPTLALAPEMILRPGLFLILLGTWWAIFGTPTLQIVLGLLAVSALVNFVVGSKLLTRVQPDRLAQDQETFAPRKWIYAAMPLAAGSGLTLLFVQIDILMLGWLSDAETLGVYRVGFQIALLSGLAYVALNLIAGERFASLVAAQDHDGLQTTARTMARAALVCALPIPVFMLLFGKQFISMLFGADFEGAYIVVLILSASHIVNAGFGMARTMLVMNGRERPVLWWTIPALLTNVVLCALLVPVAGAIGAAISVLISSVLWNVLLWRDAKINLKIESSAWKSSTGKLPDFNH